MRGRVAGVGLTVLVLAAIVAALGAPAASAACPNEAFRTGPSAFLPECRAYEMVTPVDKESGVAVEESQNGVASPSGDHVSFFSRSAFAGAGGNFQHNPYVSARSGDAWGTIGLSGVQAAAPIIGGTFAGPVSHDLGLAIIAGREVLAPGAAAGGSNLYLEDTGSGAFTLILALQDDGAAFRAWVENGEVPFVGASADWSDILISRPDGLYDFREGADEAVFHVEEASAVGRHHVRRGFGPRRVDRSGRCQAESGATGRGGDPALRATLTPRAGDANISRVRVLLPKSAFIDQAHINNPCTRVQFAANSCPASSILGAAKAESPLLGRPLEGPVYFRSNGGERQLPDIVADLDGQIHVVLVGFIDSKKQGGSSRVRATFATVPDAPVSKFVLSLKGGKRGLIENSADLCKGKQVATARVVAHSGKVAAFGSRVTATGCGSHPKKKPKR